MLLDILAIQPNYADRPAARIAHLFGDAGRGVLQKALLGVLILAQDWYQTPESMALWCEFLITARISQHDRRVCVLARGRENLNIQHHLKQPQTRLGEEEVVRQRQDRRAGARLPRGGGLGDELWATAAVALVPDPVVDGGVRREPELEHVVPKADEPVGAARHALVRGVAVEVDAPARP